MSSEDYKIELPSDLPSLPKGWFWTKLSQLVDQDRGICYGIVQPGKHHPEGVPMVNTGDILNGAVNHEIEFRVDKKIHDQFRRSTLKGGELLVTLVGANFGRIAIAPMSIAGYNCSRAVGVVPVLGNSEFVMFALRSPLARHFFDTWANTTAQPTFNLKELGRMPIPVPPSEEIRIITNFLKALDDRITLLRETNATLEAMAQALFKSWFVDFDPVHANAHARAQHQNSHPQAVQPNPAPQSAEAYTQNLGLDAATAALFPDHFQDSDLGPIPAGWRVAPMADISTVGIGKTPPRKETHWFSENPEDMRWVSIRDMGDYGIYASQSSEYLTPEAVERFNVRVVPDNTVLMSFKMTIGRVAITSGTMTTNEAIAHFRLEDQSQLTTEYIYLYLKQFDYSSLSSTSSIADAVNSKTVREIPIVVPSNDVLQAFHLNVEPILLRIKENEKQAQTLTQLRDTLLPRLISGQLRVPETVID